MKSLNIKLAVTAIAIAMLATPALAQQPQPQQQPQQRQTWNRQRQLQDYYAGNAVIPNDPALHYPNPVARSGSADSLQSGAEFNLGY